jgi:NADH-quinone oxidoreductase subunit H
MPWTQVLTDVFYTVVFPGFLFASIVGLLLTWVDRKVTAIVQSRVGPPWFQPYADIGKLLGKRMFIPRGSQAVGFLAAPLLSVAGSTLAAVIILLALLHPGSDFVGDLIVLIYLSVLPSIALVIGGASSRSPFGAIGAGRELSMILSYELVFLLSLFTVLIKVHSVRLGDIVAYQAAHGPIIASVSGFIAFVVAMYSLVAKLGYLPFDIAEADTELIGPVPVVTGDPVLLPARVDRPSFSGGDRSHGAVDRGLRPQAPGRSGHPHCGQDHPCPTKTGPSAAPLLGETAAGRHRWCAPSAGRVVKDKPCSHSRLSASRSLAPS